MNRKIGLIFLVFFTNITQLLAASLQLKVERTAVSQEDQLVVQVILDGARNAPSPSFPEGQGYTVQYGGVSQQMQIINGRMNSQAVFTFFVSFDRTGSVDLGPATTQLDGKTLTSNTLKIQVLKPSEKPPEETYYFVESQIDKNEAYVGEKVLYVFKFYNRAQIANAELNMPKFDGFWKEELGKQREYRETREGIDWQVTEIRVALFPNGPGQLKIDPAVLGLDAVIRSQRRRGVGSFFDDAFFGSTRTKRVRLTSESFEVRVKGLPVNADVKTNLVGKFEAKAALSKTSQINVGESLTLTVGLSGEGNVWDAKLGKLSLDSVKTYEDKPTVEKAERNGKLWAKKEFKLALVPSRGGEVLVPSMEFPFFNPETQKYEVAKTAPISIVVNGSDGGGEELTIVGSRNRKKQDIQVFGSDLMPPMSGTENVESKAWTQNQVYWMLAFNGLFPMFYGVLFALRRRREKYSHDLTYQKMSKALSQFRRALNKVGADTEDAPERLAKAFIRYLNDRLGENLQGLTTQEVERILPAEKFGSDLIAAVKSTLSKLDACRFGGTELRGEELASIKEELESNVQKIERKAP